MSHDAQDPTPPVTDPNLPSGHSVETHPSAAEVGPGYEVRDTNVRAIILFIVGLFLFLVVAQTGLYGFLKGLRGEQSEAFTPAAGAPETIVRQLRELREYEQAVLDGKAPAASAAPAAGRMSIDRAIDVLAERGIPPLPGPLKTEAEVNSHSGTPAPTPDEARAKADSEPNRPRERSREERTKAQAEGAGKEKAGAKPDGGNQP